MDKKKGFRELIRYGIVGVSTTIINIGIYQLYLTLGLDYKWANLIALVAAKNYGYFANKLFVFRSHCKNMSEFFKEMFIYITARGVTGLFDYFGTIISVELFRADEVITKYIIQVIVIILNFVLGKFLVFHKNDEKK